MQAMRPSKPTLARLIVAGEFRYSTSSMVALGRIWSMCRRSKTQAIMETARQTAEIMVVRRRAVIVGISALALRKSFQVPAFENQDCAAQRHRGIEHGI